MVVGVVCGVVGVVGVVVRAGGGVIGVGLSVLCMVAVVVQALYVGAGAGGWVGRMVRTALMQARTALAAVATPYDAARSPRPGACVRVLTVCVR